MRKQHERAHDMLVQPFAELPSSRSIDDRLQQHRPASPLPSPSMHDKEPLFSNGNRQGGPTNDQDTKTLCYSVPNVLSSLNVVVVS